MKCGLLKISQEAAIVGDVSYYDYTGLLIETDERYNITRALGPNNKVTVQFFYFSFLFVLFFFLALIKNKGF